MTRRANVTLNVRTAVLLGRSALRMRAGRAPWQSRRAARRRRR